MDQEMQDDSPPAMAQRNGGFVYLDAPDSGVRDQSLIACSGWMIRDGSTEITFEVNGVAVEHVRPVRRDPVKAMYPGMDVAGFEFWIDAYRCMRPPSRAIHLVARGKRVLAERFFWVRPRDLAESRRSLLTLFLHMSKTGGTAIRQEMEAVAAAASPSYQGILAAYYMPHVMALTPETVSQYDFIFGHLWHGAHKIAQARPYTYLTVLREPNAYLESLYFYQKDVAGEIGHRSIFEFLADPNHETETDNHFVRMLSGRGRRAGPITPDDVRMAIANIDRDFAFVGITEDMPRTLQRFSEITGFDLRGTGRENVTPLTDERRTLDRGEFAAAARKHVKYDLEIYRYVKAKFFDDADASQQQCA